MTDIPWNREAHLIRRLDGSETVEGQGVLHQLVGAFLEMSPDRQRGLCIRVASPGSAQEFDEATIRELAARPEYTGGYGRYDSEMDTDEPDLSDEADETIMEAGVSGPSER